ncbi:MAG: cation:proton antiporter [Armatimonadota bacterium]|nr:cation:proton antiporter [bacterium]MCS7310665.1 cation:proton antiporter [Armatimonadota bacterium]MDW8289512.1 cation:proton antiporter [Armatimonadota bacterium]
MNIWWTALVWIALALAASVVSVRLALSVALAEILFGMLGGNLFQLQPNEWVNFLAGLGGVLLTFLAGAEIEPEAMRQHWKTALTLGFFSFLAPFLGAMAYAYYVAGWGANAAKIAGIALSTTSVAVVYAVMIETGMNRTPLGKLLLAACFVTDLGTVVALGLLFAHTNLWLLVFVTILAVTLALAPSLTRWFFRQVGAHTSEPQVKFVLLLLLMLGALAVQANSEAVLGAYLLGLVLAGTMAKHRDFLHRIRSMTFTLLTPFYFLKAGSYISLPTLWGAAGLISVLLGVKVAAKVVGCYPLCRLFRMPHREATYTTLLMSTGLTFGTISALFGLTHGHITQAQYTVLVTVVIGSALVPTLIAQAFFKPSVEEISSVRPEAARQASLAYDEG